MADESFTIERFVAEVERQGLNCLRVVVMRRGKKVAEHGWASEASRSVYSVSKSFVSVAVGMAVEAGKLSTESSVVDFFPELIPAPSEKLLALKMRHLLGMSRGHGEFSRPATVAEALAQPLEWQPGERFTYDNGSTLLASAMFTRAVGL
ncbi:MAG: beta-lactamase family protein, partial [Treponema sp.]|nr:beta-lactamase family protein [Treponema sp.]